MENDRSRRQKQVKLKGGIFSKIMKTILLPFIAVLIGVGLMTTMLVKQALFQAKETEIENVAGLNGSRVDTYFTGYQEMARQMAANHSLQLLMEELEEGQVFTDSDRFGEIQQSLVNSAANDTENILVTWIADFNASQFAESSGYVTAKGEWDVTTRDWYNQVKEAKDVVLSEPYMNASTNSLVVSVIAPVWTTDGGDIIGVAGVDLTLSNLQSVVGAMAFGDTGRLVLVSEAGMIISGQDSSTVEQNVQDVYGQEVGTLISGKKTGAAAFTYQGIKYEGYVESVGNTGWSMMSVLTRKEYTRDYTFVKNVIFIVFSVAVAGMTGGNILVSKSITRPLVGLADAANEIAEGRLDVAVDVKTQGETGLVAGALAKTVERLQTYIVYIDEITAVLNQIAAGDLRFELKQDYAGEFARIREALLNISTTLTDTMQNIGEAASRVSGGSGNIAEGAESLSQGTMDQAASVEELQATITSISGRIEANAQEAREANEKSEVLKSSVNECNSQMRKMVDAMEDISGASNEIQKIIETIEKIANQTSMLSLNASIEAARAGEMGKGFAVVAGQVGGLAGSSMEASKESTRLIINALHAVERGMVLTEETNKVLQSVVNRIEEMSESMRNISEASRDQADAVNQIMDGVEQISAVIQENSAMAEESSASAHELAEQARKLDQLIGVFKL